MSKVRQEPRIKTCKVNRFRFFKAYPNLGEAISLEQETQTNKRRTRRYSELSALSRSVLRAAHTAPTHFIAELKRSAKIKPWNLKFVFFFLFSPLFSA
jgi:hypothetical protein